MTATIAILSTVCGIAIALPTVALVCACILSGRISRDEERKGGMK